MQSMSCVKIAEPVEMVFRMWTQIGPRHHDHAWIPKGKGQFWGHLPALVKYREYPA